MLKLLTRVLTRKPSGIKYCCRRKKERTHKNGDQPKIVETWQVENGSDGGAWMDGWWSGWEEMSWKV